MGGLLRLLGIERKAKAEGSTGAEEDVVANGSDTTVVDFALWKLSATIFPGPIGIPVNMFFGDEP